MGCQAGMLYITGLRFHRFYLAILPPGQIPINTTTVDYGVTQPTRAPLKPDMPLGRT